MSELLHLPRHLSIFGFDRLFNEMERQLRGDSKYPPYDIIKPSDNQCEIRLAVAGFTKDDITVELDKNVLRVKGAKIKKVGDTTDVAEPIYLYNGISNRSFNRSFVVSELIEVKSVSLTDGILSILMEEIVPDEQKPKQFTIA